MNRADRLEWLINEHSKLDKQIQLLEKTYPPQDDITITHFKKKKLKIKDQIQQLQEESNE